MFRPKAVAWAVLLTLALGLIPLAGCQRAARQPAPGQSQQERLISLFVNETGETKKIKIEEYVQGVVAAEMETDWSVNALAAQAILARTFTMKKIEMGGVKVRQTDASTNVKEFQAYAPSKINDNVRQAVSSTRGVVATYQGKYINAWFHADGGGKTAASAEEGLAYTQEPAPYIKSVSDPGFSITKPENKSWTAKFEAGKVRQAVKQVTGLDPGDIASASIVEKGPSGRATKVKIGGATLSAPALRLALGNDVMRSTLLDQFSVSGGELVVSGKGYGHGVGMSQYGARALADQGKKPEDIVNYFFTGIKLEKQWS